MTSDPAYVCGDGHCVTCGDDGDPMTVMALDDARGLALCADEGGSRSTVEIALVLPVAPGDRLLVHAGTAIARLSDARAATGARGTATG